MAKRYGRAKQASGEAQAADKIPPQTQAASAVKAKWTVMVYMAAVRDDIETERAAIRDLRELERVGSTDDVKVIVQLDRSWPGIPECYVVGKGRSVAVPLAALDGKQPGDGEAVDGRVSRMDNRSSSGSKTSLQTFLHGAQGVCPAERYLLVLWGHAFGLGFGRDHGDPLTLQEIREALTPSGTDQKIDLLGANACAMSYAEAAYELRDSAEYMVAPEITMPFSGWPYAAILRRLGDEVGKRKGKGVDARAAGDIVVEEFMRAFRRRGVALSLLRLSNASVLATHVAALASAVTAALALPDVGERVIDSFLDSAHGDVRPLIDLTDLCENLQAIDHAACAKAAGDLVAALSSGKNALVARHEADEDLEGLNGLGIFVPAITNAADLQRLEIGATDYKNLSLMVDSSNLWTELVYARLATALDDVNQEIDELVSLSGASARDDRGGVGQLLISAKRSFDKLEDVVRSAKDTLRVALKGPSNKLGSFKKGTSAEPLFLRLLDGQSTPTGARVKTAPPVLTGRSRDAATASLRDVEIALTATERMLRRVLTNGSLGLGTSIKPGFGAIKPGFGAIKPGFGDVDGIKPGFGESIKPGFGDNDGIKPGFGDIDGIKPGFGDNDGVKPGFGSSLQVTGGGAVLTGDMIAVAQMFSAVAAALRSIEEALARVERSAFDGLPNGTPAGQRLPRTIEQVERAVRDLEDVIGVARQTCFWVLRHPVHGLGPIGGDSSGQSRRQLATVGGLSALRLQLL